MEILASAPLRTGSVLWQEEPGQFTLTLVCKATYALAPLVSPLAAEPEDVNERDNFWDDDPQKSLYAPSDLVPMKPAAEVVLVGAAFAPRGEPARSLVARLAVGELDKSIEVFGPRAFLADGTLQEGPRWTQMPLRYERAAGGEASWNPVGVSADQLDGYGRHALPNLQPPGLSISKPSDVIEAIGFGPIAPRWPGRRDRLIDPAWSDERWTDRPLGAGLDGDYFQSSPPDQRVEALRHDEQIVLENLHPEHPRLVTKLAGVRPRARVEVSGMPGWDLTLVADTLWIDTLRGICTLTWRGQIPLDDRDQPGLIRVALEEPGRPIRWPSSDLPPASHAPFTSPQPAAQAASNRVPRSPAPVEPSPDFGMTATDDAAIVGFTPPPTKPVLPFQRTSPTRVSGPLRAADPPAQINVPSPKKPLATLSQRGPLVELWVEDDRTETVRETAPPPGAMPAWLEPGAPPAAAPSASVPSRPATRPPEPTALAQSIGAQTTLAQTAPAQTTLAQTTLAQTIPGVPRSTPLPPIPPPSSFGLRPPEPVITARDDRALASAAYAGVLEASNAAADSPPPRRVSMRSEPAPALAPHTLVELVWHDPAKAARLREGEVFAPYLPPPAPPPAGGDDEDAKARAAEARARAARADVAAALARAPAVHDVEGALLDAVGNAGDLVPPLVLLAGELELGLDEVKMLEAMLGAAVPLAAGDKKLKEVVDLAGEVMKTPLGASPGVAAGLLLRVREAWVKANRLLPADYLDVHTKRLLLEQRSYQKRELWGDAHLRAVLHPGGDAAGIPAYLPASLSKQLPLFTRFGARLLAEAYPQQDQLESHPIALRVTALGRVVTGKGRR